MISIPNEFRRKTLLNLTINKRFLSNDIGVVVQGKTTRTFHKSSTHNVNVVSRQTKQFAIHKKNRGEEKLINYRP